jgi:hypothetical protein
MLLMSIGKCRIAECSQAPDIPVVRLKHHPRIEIGGTNVRLSLRIAW